MDVFEEVYQNSSVLKHLSQLIPSRYKPTCTASSHERRASQKGTFLIL
jgi:hypothetical protein